MSTKPDTSEWMTQARRGLIELCILTLVGQEPRYGYELLIILARWPQLAVSEGTLYPLLRRLEREEIVTAQWRESEAGPPRKYYALNSPGRQRRDALAAEWAQLTQAVTELQSYLVEGTSTGGAEIMLASAPHEGEATPVHEKSVMRPR